MLEPAFAEAIKSGEPITIELDGIKGRFPLPDFSAQYRRAGKWGHVQLAGIVRQIKWDDMLDDQFDLSGSETGWGVNLSSNLKIKDDVLRLQAVDGHAHLQLVHRRPRLAVPGEVRGPREAVPAPQGLIVFPLEAAAQMRCHRALALLRRKYEGVA